MIVLVESDVIFDHGAVVRRPGRLGPHWLKMPLNPQYFAGVQSGPMLAGSKVKLLRLTSTFWVFHRQSL